MSINVLDIVSWADRRDSQSLLPTLIRRILISTKKVLKMRILSDEGIQRKGWDGIVEMSEAAINIPSGLSVWEFSTEKNISVKATSDYEKRSRNSLGINAAESTYIFVTPRVWSGKDKWIADKKNDRRWKDVLVFDAYDIITWLESTPVVNIWFLSVLGKQLTGVTDIEAFWMDWSQDTNPPLTSDFLIKGREKEKQMILDWFNKPTSTISVKASSTDEVLAFIAAVIHQLPLQEQELLFTKIVIITDLSHWSVITSNNESLFIIPLFNCNDILSRAWRNNHYVIIPLGNESVSTQSTIQISNLKREVVEAFLKPMNYSQQICSDLSLLASKNFIAFRRQIAVIPERKQPSWSNPENGRILLPAILLGSWDESKEGDKTIISKIANKTYNELREKYVSLTQISDPPFTFYGDIFSIISRNDSWLLLSRYITEKDIELFRLCSLDILSSTDPRYDLKNEERWMVGVIGKDRVYSQNIYDGVLETLAILSYYNGDVTFSKGSIKEYVDSIVYEVLKNANSDWKLWASLSTSLKYFAEASPDLFLHLLDEGITNNPSLFISLFTDERDSFYSGTSPHIGILYSLETLAWNPNYISHVSLILSKLIKLDPGGQYHNRPVNSIRSIFFLLDPQTYTSLKERLNVLDTLITEYPTEAWNLLINLIPGNHESWSPSSKPRWSKWFITKERSVSYKELFEGVHEIVIRLVKNVGVSGNKWSDLISKLSVLPPSEFELVLHTLELISSQNIQFTDRLLILNKLREEISTHNTYIDSDWAMPKDKINLLIQLHSKLATDNYILKYSWLFDYRPNILEGNSKDYDVYNKLIDVLQYKAVKDMISKIPIINMSNNFNYFKNVFSIGFNLGKLKIDVESENFILSNFSNKDNNVVEFIRGYLRGKNRDGVIVWSKTVLNQRYQTWTDDELVFFLIQMPCNNQTWDIINTYNLSIKTMYWKQINALEFYSDFSEEIYNELLNVKRFFTLISLLDYHVKKMTFISSDLIANILELNITAPVEYDPPPSLLDYHISQLIGELEKRKFDEQRLARLEWSYLFILDKFEMSPILLYNRFAADPQFYMDLINIVYSTTDNSSSNSSQNEKNRLNAAFTLLNKYNIIPGTLDNGGYNAQYLRKWIMSVRELAVKSDKLKITDHLIGSLLSNSIVDLDGTWPHNTLREIIEEFKSPDVDEGFISGIFKSFHATIKNISDGGAPERKSAEKYNEYASLIKNKHPRCATILRRIASDYEERGRREDSFLKRFEL